MPRLTWMNKKPPPRVNHLAATLKAYKQAKGMTSEDMAKLLGCSAENVRGQLRKPAGDWKVRTIMRYCDVLEVPYREAFEAIEKSRLPAVETGKRQRKTVT